MSPDRVFKIGELLLGVAVLVLGAFVAIETFEMPVSVASGGGGPKLFPFMISAGLFGVGGWLLYVAYARGPSEEQRVELALDWLPVVTITFGFVVMILLLEIAGWIPTGAILFVAGARAFGSRSYIANMLIGLGLAGLIFVLFDYGLSLDLPLGSIVENVVDPLD